MVLTYFPVNAAWGFLFGTDARSASHVSMDGQFLFENRSEAVTAANRAGLAVDSRGCITVIATMDKGVN